MLSAGRARVVLFFTFSHFKGCPLGGCLAACSCTSAPCMGAEKLNGSPPQCGTAVGMLDLVRDAFARPTNNFPQTGPCGPIFCPVLCSEGPSMAVSCSAHAVTHVKVHHGPPPGHWNGRWRRGTTLRMGHSGHRATTGGCGVCRGGGRPLVRVVYCFSVPGLPNWSNKKECLC